MKFRFLTLCILHATVATIFASQLSAQTGNNSSSQKFDVKELQSAISSTIKKVSPAVVLINGSGSMFSGVIVSTEGHVFTAGHTIRPNRNYRVSLTDGREFTATSFGSSESLDCGLLKITKPSDLPTAAIGDSSRVVAYQPCLSLSYPGGQRNRREAVVRFGYVNRTGGENSMLQTTALMEPGDSGGPLFDLNGQIIGVHSRIGKSMDRNYDVPINRFKKYWDQLNTAESFSATSGPPLPKFGFVGEESREGIKIFELVEGDPAEKAGFNVDDVLTKINGKDIDSFRTMRDELRAALKQNANTLEITLQRGEEQVVTNIAFTKGEKQTTPVPRIPGIDASTTLSSQSRPRPAPELANFENYFSDLESRLDDQCVAINSRIGGKTTSINATRLANSSRLISKSSMVGEDPSFSFEGKQYKLKVIARNSDNDLVLLESTAPNKHGINIDESPSLVESSALGLFLLTPSPEGSGAISVLSTTLFSSQKQESRGFLGVVPRTFEEGGVILDTVMDGAAKKAGLEKGDIIVQMNDTEIRTRPDIDRFLATVDPNTKVKATFLRNKETRTMDIVLGARTSESNHAADMMDKSGRRDGFTTVFSHDADLKPEECGGPVFDLDGKFVGLNIARHSRVRSFAVPPNVIQAFVKQYVPQK